jgi:hypothetical protein
MEAQPSCTPPEPRVAITSRRAPFPDAAPAPLDLVVPVASFAASRATDLIGTQMVEGVPAIGVRVTAAQTAPLTAGLFAAGNWRQIHPSDVVDLWLSEDTLTPVAMTIRASADPDRALWAARHGYQESAGDVVVEIAWSDIVVNPASLAAPPAAPLGAAADAAFVDGGVDAPWLGAVPDGMVLHRSGATAAVSTMSWSDGRAWLRLSWTSAWDGSRLFGDLGDPVRRIDRNRDVAYVDDAGRRVAIHGEALDILVTGSLSTADLLAFAMDLDVTGTVVPSSWPEAGSGSLEDATAALGSLLVPDRTRFGDPAIDVDDGVVTMGYSGAGERGFVVVESVGELPPPVTGDIVGATVRGRSGRWTPGAGTLEWVEDGLVVTLRSTTLSRSELIAVADSMARR